MFLFQVISFVFEITFIVFIGGLFAFNPDILSYKYKNKSNKAKVITFIESKKDGRNIINKVGRIMFSLVIVLMTFYFLYPYLLDIPRLLSGNYNYTEGYVREIRSVQKSPYQYVGIGGKEVKFFFSHSNIEEGKKI